MFFSVSPGEFFCCLKCLCFSKYSMAFYMYTSSPNFPKKKNYNSPIFKDGKKKEQNKK